MAFNIFEYANGTTHPEDTVDINVDRATAYKIVQIEKKLDSHHKLAMTDAEVKQLEKEGKALRKKLDESKVTLTLKGITTEKRVKIQDEVDSKYGTNLENDERNLRFEALMFQASFVSATDAKGNEDTSSKNVSGIEKFITSIPQEARENISRKMAELSIRSDEFEFVENSATFS